MHTKLRHVAIRAADLPRTVRFYRDLLGLTMIGPRQDAFDLTDGELNLTLLPYGGPHRPAAGHGYEFIHLGLIVHDLSEVMKRLQRAGYPVVMDDVKEGREFDPNNPPSRSFKVSDPDGIILDITCDPAEWPGVRV